MDVSDLKIILTSFLIKFPKETNKFFFLADVNINLLNYNDHQLANEFLDSLTSNSFIPHILQPARVTGYLKPLLMIYSLV